MVKQLSRPHGSIFVALEETNIMLLHMLEPNPPDTAVHVFLFVVTVNCITLHQHREQTHTFCAILSCICSLPVADSDLSPSFDLIKACDL